MAGLRGSDRERGWQLESRLAECKELSGGEDTANSFIVAAANSLPERASGKHKTCAPVYRLVRSVLRLQNFSK